MLVARLNGHLELSARVDPVTWALGRACGLTVDEPADAETVTFGGVLSAQLPMQIWLGSSALLGVAARSATSSSSIASVPLRKSAGTGTVMMASSCPSSGIKPVRLPLTVRARQPLLSSLRR